MLSKRLFLNRCLRHFKVESQSLAEIKRPTLTNITNLSTSNSSTLKGMLQANKKIPPVFESLSFQRNLQDSSEKVQSSPGNKFKLPAVVVSAKSNVLSLFSTPFPFMAYGLGGLIPFAIPPIYMKLTGFYEPTVAHAQLVYGATIISFLGGVSWGESLEKKSVSLKTLGYSIGLPLVGWVSVLVPSPAGFFTLISALGYAGYVDTTNMSYPQWFRNLRCLLSSIVIICFFTTVYYRFSKSERQSVQV